MEQPKKRKARRTATYIISYFSSFMVVLFAAMSVISYSYSFESLKARTISDTEVVLAQVGRNIGQYLASIESISGIIITNKDVTSYLAGKTYDPYLARTNMYSFLNYVPQFGEDIVSIFLFGKEDELVYAPSNVRMKEDYDITKDAWYQAVQGTRGEPVITETQVRTMTLGDNPWVISHSRKILDQRTGEGIGTLLIELNYRAIDEIMSDVNLGRKGYAFVVDNKGNYVYHPQLQLIYSGLKNEDVGAVLSATESTLVLNDQNKMYTIGKVPGSQFFTVGVTDLNELSASAGQMYQVFTVLALVMGLVALLGSAQLAKRITRPFGKLEKAVGEVEQGDLNAKFEVSGTYEAERFAGSLSAMTGTVKQLMEQVVYDQEMIRTSELRALQSQINPHFLYNTLDSIVWIAEEAGNDRIKDMTVALANYFRIVLSSGKDIITVREEVEHIRSYLVIQTMRYENLTYSFDIDEGILNLTMPKLILQPIVENAIYHGIKNSSGSGEITVRGYQEGEKLVFEIRDNGRGMRPSELRNVFSQRQRIRQGGIGLTNIKERIELYYGGEYGLQFESVYRKGTCVKVTLPVRYEV